MELRVQGIIIGYCDDVSAGVIQSADGHKYQFERSDWKSSSVPQAKSLVTFANHAGRATEVRIA